MIVFGLSSGIISAAGLNLNNISRTPIEFELILTNNEVRKGTLQHGESAKIDAFFEGFKSITVARMEADATAVRRLSLNIPGLTPWSDITFASESIVGKLNQADGKQLTFEAAYTNRAGIGGNRP